MRREERRKKRAVLTLIGSCPPTVVSTFAKVTRRTAQVGTTRRDGSPHNELSSRKREKRWITPQ